MKFNYILLLAFLTITLSCGPEVVFYEPQPKGTKENKRINVAYRGSFYCQGDDTVVEIDKKTIVKSKEFDLGIPIEDVDSNEDLIFSNNELRVRGTTETFPARLKNDTVFSEITLRDTIFHLSNQEIAKSYKGHLLLNYKLDNGDWEVLILSLNSYRDIIISEAFIPDDLEALKKITPVEDLSNEEKIQIRISPDYSEFERIISEGLLFKTCEMFYRTQNPPLDI